MKIKFEGTIEEFQDLFFGTPIPDTVDVFDPSDQDDTTSFGVIDGDKADMVEPYLVDPEPPNPSQPHNEMPEPKNDPSVSYGLNLPKIKPENRKIAWEKFKETCVLWTQGFGETEEKMVEKKRPRRDETGKVILDERNKPTHETYEVLEEVPVPQPDRLEAIRELGQGKYPIPVLVMAYEIGSLQRMVERALIEAASDGSYSGDTSLEYSDRIAMNMIQICHIGFPDLQGTYDYSSKWQSQGAN